MTALDKTDKIKRLSLAAHQLVKQKNNPNKMSSREFDLLVDNLNRVGFVDPIMVTETGDKTDDGLPMYRIVGGHHRFEAASYLGFVEFPATVLEFDDNDEEQFQIVRMNVIRGKLDPTAFFSMYNEMSEKYTDEILQDAFGFAEEQEFKRLIAQTAKTLPDKAMQKKFKEAAKEIKTIDGLSKLLNEIFTKHGDTLPYGYLVFDYGGERSVWLHASKKTIDAMDIVGAICVDRKRTVDDLIGGLVQLIAKGHASEFLDKLVAASEEVELPDGMAYMPTKSNLDKAGSI